MIIYKDKDIAVCNKPYGVASQQADKNNMIDMLKSALGTEVYPVHRLDTTTTGLIVYALNKESAADLSDLVASSRLTKEYYAIAHGKIEGQGELNDFLYHDRIKNKSFIVKGERKGARAASLSYFVKDVVNRDGEDLSLVRIRLRTGRTHQIRVQLANIGSPLYGDGKYGAKDNGKIKLHSCYISFTHPTTKKQMEFSLAPKGDLWDEFKITE